MRLADGRLARVHAPQWPEVGLPEVYRLQELEPSPYNPGRLVVKFGSERALLLPVPELRLAP